MKYIYLMADTIRLVTYSFLNIYFFFFLNPGKSYRRLINTDFYTYYNIIDWAVWTQNKLLLLPFTEMRRECETELC